MNPSAEAIRGLWITMSLAWGKGDARLFASVFDEEADFVSVRGGEQSGRAQIEQGHAHLFATGYRDSRMEAEVRLIRHLADGLALVHATSVVTPAGDAPPMRTHAQAVVSQRARGWSIIAFHNMVPVMVPAQPKGK